MEKITKKQISSRIGLVKAIVAILNDAKAADIKVLKVEKKTILTNYFIICEGRSSTHVRSLSGEVEEKLSDAGLKPIARDGHGEGNWVVRDYASVIVHIFDAETRRYYNLEKLWADGENISLTELTEKTDEK